MLSATTEVQGNGGGGAVLALVDSSLPDQDLLRASLGNALVVSFDSHLESAREVLDRAATLAGTAGGELSSVMIFSHGAAGEFALGDDIISAYNVDAAAQEWRSLAGLLSVGGSIDLFACSTAATADGQALIERLNQITGRTVFASTDVTGQHGDWILEASSDGSSALGIEPLDSDLLRGFTADLNLHINNQPIATPSPVTGTSTVLTVGVVDTVGMPTITWSLTSQPAGSTVTFSDNGTTTATTSTATFDRAGSYTFLVSAVDGAASDSASRSVTVNQTLTSIVVSPATPTLATGASQAFTAVAKDQFGQALSVQPTITWSKTGIGSLTAGGVYTAPSGGGSAVITATSGSISGNTTVTVTNAAPTVATPAGATPSPVSGTSTSLSVLGADDGPETDLIYTWSVTAQPAGAAPLFSVNGDNVAKSTSVTFDLAGSYTFLVTIFDGVDTVTSSVSVVVDQTLTSLLASPAAVTLNLNDTQQFAATAYDQFGHAMASQPTIAWNVVSGAGSVSNSGLYTAPGSVGAATVEASSGGVTASASVTIANGSAPTIAVAAAAVPASVTGTTTSLSVLGDDDNGEANLTYTWAATTLSAGASPAFSQNGTNAAKNTTVTFDDAGSYVFEVTVSDGTNSTTSSVAVTVVQTVSTLSVSPGTAAVTLLGSQSFSATVDDQFGHVISGAAVTWSVSAGSGSITSGGVYTASNTVGTETVTASSGGVSGSASVTVSNTAPTVATAADAVDVLVSGTGTNLSVLGDDDAGESQLIYTWSASTKPTGATPTFSQNGTNAAKNVAVTFDRAGSYVLTVTISDANGASVTSSVAVTVDQTLSSVVVSPSSATIPMGTTQSFAAVAYDQFGIALASQPTLTWTVASGSGSINAAGLYTAPAMADTVTITASSGGVTGSAGVTVVDTATLVAVVAADGTTADFTVVDVIATGLTYTWSTLSKPAGAADVAFSANGTTAADAVTGSFDTLGSYTVRVRISDGVTSTDLTTTVVVTAHLTTIAIAPAAIGLALNQSTTFVATAYDQFGGTMSFVPVWTLLSGGGAIDSGGLYTAPNVVGAAVVRASSGSVSATASITVGNTAPTIASPASATLTSATTATLSVLGADDNGEAGLTYTWSLTGTPPAAVTYQFNGSHAAGNTMVTFAKAGTYQFLVTISDGEWTVTDSVQVTVAQVVTTIAVSGDSVPMYVGGSKVLSALAYDQFSQLMATQPSLAWSVVSGPGAVDASGRFTADATAGTTVIAATGGGVQGNISLTTLAQASIDLQVAAEQIRLDSSTAVLRAIVAGDYPGLTYTWELIGFEPMAPSSVGTSGLPAVQFSLNGTNAAKVTTATFSVAGRYTFRVTAEDTAHLGTQEVSVSVLRGGSTDVRMVSGVQPVVVNGSIQGLVITFNGALDRDSAEQLSAYRLTRVQQRSVRRSWLQRAFSSDSGRRFYYTRIGIVSATYDDQVFQVTLTLARPLRMGTATWHLAIDTQGQFAVRDDAGDAISPAGARATNFHFAFATQTGRHFSFRTATGRLAELDLQGPGVVTMCSAQPSYAPSLWLRETTPQASRLVIRALADGTEPATIAQLVGSSTVQLELSADVLIGLLLD